MHIAMAFAYIGNVNTYFIPMFYYLTIHITSFQFIYPYLTKWQPNAGIIASILPFCYVLLVINIVLVCLFFKIKNINPYDIDGDMSFFQRWFPFWGNRKYEEDML